MRFFIVAPRSSGYGEHYGFPLGLGYISASLKQAGFDVECLNTNHYRKPVKELLQERLREGDVLCTGGLSVHYGQVHDIINTARQLYPDIKVIIGGGLLSSEPELMFSDLRPTIGVLGEGEETIVEVAQKLSIPSEWHIIKGIIYYGENGIVITEPRPVIRNLDDLPFPDYEGFELKEYLDWQIPSDDSLFVFDKPRAATILLSRSCPYLCTFCYHPLGNKYRRRSMDNIFKEVEYLVSKFKVNILVFADECFSTGEGELEEFCRRMKTYNVKWMTMLRVDGLDERKILLMKESGCYCLSYGLESASNTVLRSMKKHITIEQISEVLTLTSKLQVMIQGNFIFGDRAETEQTFVETMGWWSKHYHYHINLNVITPYPGTALYHYCLQKGLITDRLKYIQSGCPPVNMMQMDDKFYSAIDLMIRRYLQKYKQFGTVISKEPDGFDQIRQTTLYALEVQCPHCQQNSRYRNFEVQKNNQKLGCRNCNQRFDLS